MKISHVLAISLLGMVTSVAHASCGAAYCTLNTDWNTQGGARGDYPWLVDLHYEYINQNKLWSGTHSISASDVHEDPLEKYTYNRNLVLTADYTWGKDGVSVIAPYFERQHQHITDPTGAAIPEEWSFSALGDMKVLGRHQLNQGYGIIYGVKLPTGDYQLTNGNGILAERALQPGSGSTDLIAGGFWQKSTGLTNTRWFAQAMYQWAIETSSDYRPGNQFMLSFGLRKPFAERWTFMQQLNYTHRDHDSGAESEPDLSGFSTLAASPGLAWRANNIIQLYAFAQVPLVRHVTGVQLTADRVYVGGLSVRF